jgi:hypothetical protein
MSADDFRDLVEEFRHDSVASLRFFRVAPGATVRGTPQADVLTEFFPTGGYAYVPRSPKTYYEQLPPDKRERDAGLVWTKRDDNDPTVKLRTADLVLRTTADRVYDVDTARWYIAAAAWQYGRQAAVNGAVLELIDRDLGDPPVDV